MLAYRIAFSIAQAASLMLSGVGYIPADDLHIEVNESFDDDQGVFTLLNTDQADLDTILKTITQNKKDEKEKEDDYEEADSNAVKADSKKSDKKTDIKEAKEDKPAAKEKSTSHGVDVSNVGVEFKYPFSWQFLNDIRNGANRLYYSGSETNADFSLGEIYYNYCNLSSGAYYYPVSDETGTYLELTTQTGNEIRNALGAADSNWYNGCVKFSV